MQLFEVGDLTLVRVLELEVTVGVQRPVDIHCDDIGVHG